MTLSTMIRTGPEQLLKVTTAVYEFINLIIVYWNAFAIFRPFLVFSFVFSLSGYC